MSNRLNEEPRLADAVSLAIEGGHGNVLEAHRILVAMVQTNRKLRDELTEPLVSAACMDAIRRVFRHRRQVIWVTPRLSPDTGISGLEAMARSNARELLDFPLPLPGYPRLANADHELLDAAIKVFGDQARDMAHKARWLEMVRKGLPKGKTVADVFNEKKLRALQEKVRNNE